MTIQRTALFAALLLAATGVAHAQSSQATSKDEARPAAPEWSDSDTNRDGYLTKEELVPFPTLGQDFEKIDADHDGRISEAEYRDWRDHG
jgi:Ca2+-binding EF-hand superfamily protein